MNNKISISSAGVFMIWGIICLLPIGMLCVFSVHGPGETFTFSHFGDVLNHPKFISALKNSLLTGAAGMVVALPISLLAGFGLSRLRIPARRGWLDLFALGWIIPAAVWGVFLAEWFYRLGLDDTRVGLALIYAAMSTAPAVWIFKRAFDRIDRQVLDVAHLEGYSFFDILIHIALPRVLPEVVLVGLFCFVLGWNDLAFAFLLTDDYARTLPVWLFTWSESGVSGQSGLLAAASVILMLPGFILALLSGKRLGAFCTRGIKI